MYRHQQGFSFIELMVVVCIIAILTTMAIPSYQSHIKRARFSEILTIVEPYKMAVALALQEGYPKQQLELGTHGIPEIPPLTENVSSFTITQGVIKVAASAMIDRVTYILTPNDDGSLWKISGSCLKKRFC